jgi:transcriptional regulator with XRE-family HTH domain
MGSQAKANEIEASAVGPRLRDARVTAGISLRELARRIDISASALSQIETGKSHPSVRTLYMIVSELGLSLDELFSLSQSGPPERAETKGGSGAEQRHQSSDRFVENEDSPVQRYVSRASLRLDPGVTWNRLTARHDPDVDFLAATYDVGGASAPSDKLVVHSGREYHVVLSGELTVTLGFETYALGAGDSISFDSSEPHLIANRGNTPAEVITIVVGRRDSDARNPRFRESISPVTEADLT